MACAAISLVCPTLFAKEPIDYIDPFIGTGHQGKDFPGATTPQSMVKLSPDTPTGGATSYTYGAKTMLGFSFTHLGGSDGGELGNFLVMPTTGPMRTFSGNVDRPGTGWLSTYNKATEKASAGYYAVTLDDYKVRAEATVAPHSGILRFTFPQNAQSRIQIDLAHRNRGICLHQSVKVVDDHTIEGQMDCTKDGGGRGSTYTVYFHAEFSKTFINYGVWTATMPPGPYNKSFSNPTLIDAFQHAQVIPGCREKEGKHIGFYTEFPTQADESVSLKAGISFVSIAGARANLAAEIEDLNFEQIHQRARDLWAKALDKLIVESASEDNKTIFYSAMYRAMQFPQTYQDVDSNYTGGDGAIHRAEGFTNRTIFSGWDVYRSEYPLLTLVNPSVVNDQINSAINLAETNGTGYFDRWEIMSHYYSGMIGDPEVAVINDAYQKGIRGFNLQKAYEIGAQSTLRNGNSKYGYCPGQISETMEYGLDEWNMSQLAVAVGKKDDAAHYLQLSQAYRKLFDPNQAWTYDAEGKDAMPGWKGWFRPKDADGNFLPWLGLLSPKGTREATVYQAGWTACNDIPGMIELLGGNDLFVAKLNDFFQRAPDFTKWSPYEGRKNPYHIYTGGEPWWNPYNNPVNEPTELIPFLFNRAGAPWLTQKWVRQTETIYLTGPDGVPGDDDMGQLSAWYVLASSGLHQACPGDPRFEIFTPVFDKVTLKLDPKFTSGGTFVISAKNNSRDNVYIQSAALNGRPLNRCWLSYAEIAAGGTLDLTLGSEPNKAWGIQ